MVRCCSGAGRSRGSSRISSNPRAKAADVIVSSVCPRTLRQASLRLSRFISRPNPMILGQFPGDMKLIRRALTGTSWMAEPAIMKTIHLRVGSTFASGLVLAVLAATAQEAPTAAAAKQGNAGRVTVERDKEKEDQVATMLEGIWAEKRLPQLRRITHRRDLEQGVCTSALSGDQSKRWSSFYTTPEPGLISPELKKLASSNRLDRNKRAGMRGTQSQSGG